MRPVGGGIHECIVLDGLKTKAVTNSDDPPNSFHTSDLFIAHPIIPNAWKFVGRSDDRVTLLNGEKVLPLPIEGAIVQDLLVREAVVCGIDRIVPGLLLFRSNMADGLTDGEFLDRVWPTIEKANKNSEAFSQISREMIAVIPSNVDCPSTDKASIKRAQVYREFASVIGEMYDGLETGGTNDKLKLNVKGLEEWILSSFEELGISIAGTTSDFFAAGVDSLKAIQMRGLIVKALDLQNHSEKLPSMIVYDCGNACKLAVFLHNPQDHSITKNDDPLKIMAGMIETYSTLPSRAVGSGTCSKRANVVSEFSDSLKFSLQLKILTGATGSLGSHILHQLILNPLVKRVFCLVRTRSLDEIALARLAGTLETNCKKELIESAKITVMLAYLSKPDFALSRSDYTMLQTATTHIIHCAWPVNFALPLSSFAPQLASLQNILAFSLSVLSPAPAHVLFCSSIGAGMGTPPPAIIPDAQLKLSQASPTGYARSKLVAEHVIGIAVERSGAKATIMRIGQIVPSRSQGSQLWNPSEAIPLMIRSSMVLGVLPDRPGSGDQCTWLEVDVVAKAVLDLCNFRRGTINQQLVYNLVHPIPFSWRDEFLPALRTAGLAFETVSYDDWLAQLAQSSHNVKDNPRGYSIRDHRSHQSEPGVGNIRNGCEKWIC
jgi:thioester reductase-like protein